MTKSGPSRRLSRRLACQCVYAGVFSKEGIIAVRNELSQTSEEIDEGYVETLLTSVQQKEDDLMGLIAKHAPRFEIENIPGVHIAILKVAITELLYDESIPDVVAVNEGIEIAKVFTDDGGKKFINGVLDAVKKAHDGAK